MTRTREAELRSDWGHPHSNLPQSPRLPVSFWGSSDPKRSVAQCSGIFKRWHLTGSSADLFCRVLPPPQSNVPPHPKQQGQHYNLKLYTVSRKEPWVTAGVSYRHRKLLTQPPTSGCRGFLWSPCRICCFLLLFDFVVWESTPRHELMRKVLYH